MTVYISNTLDTFFLIFIFLFEYQKFKKQLVNFYFTCLGYIYNRLFHNATQIVAEERIKIVWIYMIKSSLILKK